MKLYFHDLPKISNNQFYAGKHWGERKEIKDNFSKIVKIQLLQQTKRKNFAKPCEVEYIFEFKSNPLDCSNAVGMAKMIEDVLFPDDSPKIVKKITLQSLKSIENKVTINIKEL